MREKRVVKRFDKVAFAIQVSWQIWKKTHSPTLWVIFFAAEDKLFIFRIFKVRKCQRPSESFGRHIMLHLLVDKIQYSFKKVTFSK